MPIADDRPDHIAWRVRFLVMIIDRNGGVVIGFQLYGWYRITVQGSIEKIKLK